MDLQSPILVRLFKQEAELEVWKQDRSGRFALLKTYPICRWSGDLGPKVREGDRQAPEGFYSITPGADESALGLLSLVQHRLSQRFRPARWDAPARELMVHGDCSSRGCYAMTDEQIAEIYSLGRESFFGGQRAFQFQAYPFRMTPVNMAKHRNNPNMPFWKMIKEGYDHFEVTQQEPKVDFCEKKYVFDAVKPPDAKRDPVFDASAKCPAYVIPDEIAEAVREKQQEEQAEIAKLIARGTPVARINTGIDGGMNRVFAAKLPDGDTGLSEGGDGQSLSLSLRARPAPFRSTVNPPRGPVSSPDEPLAASMTPRRLPSACDAGRVRRAEAQSDGFFSAASPARSASAARADTTASCAAAVPAKPKARGQATKPPRPDASIPKASAPKPAETRQAAARPALKPSSRIRQRRAPLRPHLS